MLFKITKHQHIYLKEQKSILNNWNEVRCAFLNNTFFLVFILIFNKGIIQTET